MGSAILAETILVLSRMRRGRPKYDDVLTPREWEVLDLLRQGKTNEQIAYHLGISVNGAKFHVSEIISKLGVSSRREAAARPVAPRIRQLAPSFLLSFGLLKFAAVAVLFLAAAGFVALAAGVLVNDNRGGSSSAVAPPPSATPVPEGPSPTPTLTTGQRQAAAAAATATAVAVRPTPTPVPVFAPAGEEIPVWVYADAEASDDCFDMVEDMVPASAPQGIAGKAVQCTMPNTARFTLVQQDDGNYHLDSVMQLVLLREDWPPREEPGLYDCTEVRDSFLRPSEAPKAATFVGVCSYVPAYRGQQGREETLVWTSVEDALAPVDLLPDAPCEVATTYLGPQMEQNPEELREVTCLLK